MNEKDLGDVVVPAEHKTMLIAAIAEVRAARIQLSQKLIHLEDVLHEVGFDAAGHSHVNRYVNMLADSARQVELAVNLSIPPNVNPEEVRKTIDDALRKHFADVRRGSTLP